MTMTPMQGEMVTAFEFADNGDTCRVSINDSGNLSIRQGGDSVWLSSEAVLLMAAMIRELRWEDHRDPR